MNKEDAGSTENGSDGQDEKESESTQKASQTLTSSAEPPRKTSPNQASASSTRPASSSTSSSDSESPSTSTMFNKDNKWIFVVLACLAFVVTFASIAFCCHQRNAKPTSMASASKSSRRETDQGERNLACTGRQTLTADKKKKNPSLQRRATSTISRVPTVKTIAILTIGRKNQRLEDWRFTQIGIAIARIQTWYNGPHVASFLPLSKPTSSPWRARCLLTSPNPAEDLKLPKMSFVSATGYTSTKNAQVVSEM